MVSVVSSGLAACLRGSGLTEHVLRAAAPSFRCVRSPYYLAAFAWPDPTCLRQFDCTATAARSSSTNAGAPARRMRSGTSESCGLRVSGSVFRVLADDGHMNIPLLAAAMRRTSPSQR